MYITLNFNNYCLLLILEYCTICNIKILVTGKEYSQIIMLFVTKPFPYMQTNLLNDYILLVLGVKKMDIYLTAPKSNFFKEISSM